MDWLRQTLSQAFAAFKEMTAAQRASMVMLGLTIVLTLGVVAFLGARPKFVTVASGLDQAEMAGVVRYLEETGEEYRTDPARGAVLIHQDRKAALRTRLVDSQVVSMEKVFSYSDFFEQGSGLHVSNRQRDEMLRIALQNELRKMIEGLAGVERARVEIMKEQDVEFGGWREQSVGAAVTLTTKKSVSLDQAMANTVIDLVHSAVRNSDPQKITVVDSANWARKFRREDPESVFVQSGTRWDLTRAVNDYYRTKIEQFIADIGYEAAVTVDAKLDLSAVRKTVYEVKGDEVVTVSLEKRKSTHTGPVEPGGAAGMDPNRPEGAVAGVSSGGSPGKPSESREDDQRIDQDYSRTLQEVVAAPGAVQGIQVAVVLFHRVVQRENQKTGQLEEIYEAPSENEKPKWSELISSAAGIDTAAEPEEGRPRSAVRVAFMKPARPLPSSFVGPKETWHEKVLATWPVARVAGLFLLATVALFFIYGLGKRAAAVRPAARAQLAGARPKGRGPVQIEPPEGGDLELHEMQRKLRGFVEQDPRKVAGLVKRWLVREG